MTPEQTALLARVRDLLAGEHQVGEPREVSMFGGRSVMVNEKMILSVLKNGGLLVRIDAESHEELLAEPGAAQAEMGKARSMGPGWIEVAAEAISGDAELGAWIERTMDYNRTVTGDKP